MQSPATLKRHAALVDDMAKAQELDLEEQILRGNLSIPDLDDAVLRCTGCTSPGDCEHWLASRAEGAPDEPLPVHCRNSALFAELKRA